MATATPAAQITATLGTYLDLLERNGITVTLIPAAAASAGADHARTAPSADETRRAPEPAAAATADAQAAAAADSAALRALPVSHVTCNSRDAVPGTLFICKGAAFKPSYLEDAVAAGAVAYLAAQPYPGIAAPCAQVDDVRLAMGLLADAAYDHPSGKLDICAFTGTKGKTTCAYYLRGILDAAARAAGRTARTPIFSTIELDDGIEAGPSKLTTPEPLDLQRHLANAVAAGADRLVMEASSQALKYGRVTATRFAVGAFINIGNDHISPIEHPTFEDYLAAKLRIFDHAETAVVNLEANDEHIDKILAAARAACPRVVTYALADPAADVALLAARPAPNRPDATLAQVRTPAFTAEVLVPSVAEFNLSNALAAIACAYALGVDEQSITAGLADVYVPGRMQTVPTGNPDVAAIVDYAHNGDELETLLATVRRHYPGREVVAVFGATGVKGVERRVGMGVAAGKLADRIVATEDDAGTEDVASICATIVENVRAQGNGNVKVVLDRTEAIRTALAETQGPAVIVVAGKGHEKRMLRAEGPVPYEGDAAVLTRAASELWG